MKPQNLKPGQRFRFTNERRLSHEHADLASRTGIRVNLHPTITSVKLLEIAIFWLSDDDGFVYFFDDDDEVEMLHHATVN